MIEELKPCPFCGGKAKLKRYAHEIEEYGVPIGGIESVSFCVECTKCGCGRFLTSNFTSDNKYGLKERLIAKEKSIKAWNTRAEPDYKAIAEEMARNIFAIQDNLLIFDDLFRKNKLNGLQAW